MLWLRSLLRVPYCGSSRSSRPDSTGVTSQDPFVWGEGLLRCEKLGSGFLGLHLHWLSTLHPQLPWHLVQNHVQNLKGSVVFSWSQVNIPVFPLAVSGGLHLGCLGLVGDELRLADSPSFIPHPCQRPHPVVPVVGLTKLAGSSNCG